MLTKLFSGIAAAAAVATYVVVSTPATTPAVAGIDASTSSVTGDLGIARAPSALLPFEGSYLGLDRQHRLVTFTYRHGRIVHFKVNQQAFPDATVQGHQWHHTCAHHWCSRGHWTTDTTVEGIWNNSQQGTEVHFTAYLFSH